MKLQNKIMIGVGIAFVAIIAGLMLMPNHKDNTKKEETTTSVKNGSLPIRNKVNYSNSPMLWDFEYSSLGYRSNVDAANLYNMIEFCVTPKGKIYAESYLAINDITIPVIGSDIQEVKVDSTKMMLQDLKSQKYKYSENGYKFYFLPIQKAGVKYFGFDTSKLTDFSYNTKGYFRTDYLDTGMGYPTAWLRKEPFESKILKYQFIDMKDSFWDKHNYLEETTYKDNKDNKIKVKTIGIDFYQYQDGSDIIKLNGVELQQVIKHYGWTKE